MPYTNQDKWEMTLRQAKVDIGQGRGNAVSNAIALTIALVKSGSLSEEKAEEYAFDLADRIFEQSQKAIERDYEKWLAQNTDKIKADLGLAERVIEIGESVDFPSQPS